MMDVCKEPCVYVYVTVCVTVCVSARIYIVQCDAAVSPTAGCSAIDAFTENPSIAASL